MTAISTYLGLTYSPFLDLLPYWFVIVALGYLQWFYVVPKVVEKLLHVLRRIVRRFGFACFLHSFSLLLTALLQYHELSANSQTSA